MEPLYILFNDILLTLFTQTYPLASCVQLTIGNFICKSHPLTLRAYVLLFDDCFVSLACKQSTQLGSMTTLHFVEIMKWSLAVF